MEADAEAMMDDLGDFAPTGGDGAARPKAKRELRRQHLRFPAVDPPGTSRLSSEFF